MSLRTRIAAVQAQHHHWDHAGALTCACGETFGLGVEAGWEAAVAGWAAHVADAVIRELNIDISHYYNEKKESMSPKITTATTVSISSSTGFTVGDLQSFLDQVPRHKGLDTPVTVSLSHETSFSPGVFTLSVTSEDDKFPARISGFQARMDAGD